MANRDRREELRGAEEETFDILAKTLTSQQWADLLKAPLKDAVREGNIGFALKLVRAGAEVGGALHEAVKDGHVDVVNGFLDIGASVADKDKSGFGNTPLHIAAREGNTEMIQLLVWKGLADIDALDDCQCSPLHAAVLCGREASALALMADGADVHLQFGEGTILHKAAAGGQVEVIRAAIKHGVHVNAQDGRHSTPLHRAALRIWAHGAADVVDCLLRSGADETILNNAGETPATVLEDVAGDTYNDQLPHEVDRVRRLLANAPADRAWRRRGYLMLCRAHPDRMLLLQKSSSARRAQSSAELGRTETGNGKGTAGKRSMDGRADGDWAVVVANVLGLQEDGIFWTVVGYL